jgi:hypothetical protein
MKVYLDNYEIVSRIFLGSDLKIVFKNVTGTTEDKVLELREVAGFIDTISKGQTVQTLRIDNEGGSYNLDLSLRLKRNEINSFQEVFLFTDKTCVNFCFRAVAKSIKFRDRTENDNWLP